MEKLTISVDMGAKNNGVYVVKTRENNIIDKKAFTIRIEEKSINFSKKSRRENRHKDRNYNRRKLAKRFLREFVDFSKYNENETDMILGLLNNRGYTFLSVETEFETLNERTIEFKNTFIPTLKQYNSKQDFEKEISAIQENELLKFLDESINFVDEYYKNKKEDIDKEFQKDFSKIIKPELKILKEFFINIKKELETGSKPREKYLQEIKDEIEKDFDFIKEFSKYEFFNLVGNISNMQLRLLRKFFNNNSSKDRYKILKKYFVSFHYKTADEKNRRKQLFEQINKYDDIEKFFENCNPILTIPPYEDMNNRDTYKCNSMLIKPEFIDDDLKQTIDFLLLKDEFSTLLITDNEGIFQKENLTKTKIIKDNKRISSDFTYSKYLQRILDATENTTTKELNPRNVFKHKAKFDKGTIDSVDCFKRRFTQKIYDSLKVIAKRYYEEEEQILNGIYQEENSMFTKCNTNTPYKNNAKHLLLKPIYSYNFTLEEADKFYEEIKNKKGLQTALKRVSEEAKKYQNSFYHTVQDCFTSKKSKDEEINKIIKNIDKILTQLQEILKDKDTFLGTCGKVDEKNLKRVINIFKQTYEILFKDINGFNKTCKCCTAENAIRMSQTTAMSDTIAKRLLSDVAKPIDGMLDMMLDRLAYEISENIKENDFKDINELEILLEQNKFEFEENLNAIKRANNSQIKKFDKDKYKDKLNIKICPYSGKAFEKGDYDHILPQSKVVYNSKANMIYCSVEGNQNIKGNKDYILEMIHEKHLKDVFGTDDITSIQNFIKQNLNTIDTNKYTNFNNLKLKEQIALRYALFMRNTQEFDKAFDLIKKDKIKTFSNGTQKRLVRLIYQKLNKKFSNEFENIKITSKVIDNQLVSTTRNTLAYNNKELEKKEIQDSHSHCIDAMVVFYLANSTIQGRADKKKENISTMKPIFDFEDIYLEESRINNLTKNKTFINSPTKELGSYKLFDDTIYAEHYHHIKKEEISEKNLETLLKYNLIYKNEKYKKNFIKDSSQIQKNTIHKIDVQKASNVIYDLFINRKKEELEKLKFLDNLRYCTSRKEIENIFFDDKKIKLLDYDKIKHIPKNSENLYKAVYKTLKDDKELFTINSAKKVILDSKRLTTILKDMFESKQNIKSKQQRKRGKKRHKFTLPILGSPKFRIKRENTWQVLGNKDIVSKSYILNGNIKAIPFFTTNTIPLSVKDLLSCLLLPNNTKNVYKVEIDVEDIKTYIKKLTYYITEATRHSVEVEFVKSQFKDIDFSLMKTFKCTDDEEFNKFVNKYIETDDYEFSKYIKSMRNNTKNELKAIASLVNTNSQTVTIQYKADTNAFKKQIILKNIK